MQMATAGIAGVDWGSLMGVEHPFMPSTFPCKKPGD
jgi:hypothetical protein